MQLTSKKFLIVTAVLALLAPAVVMADVPFTTQTGTLAVANDTVTLPSLQGESSCSVEVSGTWTGAITPEVIINSTWVGVLTNALNSTASLSTITANGDYTVPCSSYRGFRVRLSTATSGSATVTINASQGVSPYLSVGPIPLPVTASTPFPVTAATTLPVSIATTVPVSIASPVTVTATSPLPVSTPGPYKFFQMQSQTTATTIVTGTGTFYGFTNISGNTGMSHTTTCYDNASTASGTVLGSSQLSQNSSLVLAYGIHFANGLTCLNGGTLSANGIDVLYTNP